MGLLSFEVPHTLPKEEARKRLEQLTRYWAGKYGVASRWSGDEATLSGKVMGISLSATLKVTESKVGGEATDPGMLLRGKAKKYLTHKFNSYLDPAKTLEQLGGEKED
jgi:hypothetical protein